MTGEPERSAYDKILARRAEALARTPDLSDEREIELTVAVVRVGEERIGLPVEGLREIIRVPGIVPLPRLPHWHRGIVALRGEILSVIDLAEWLNVGGAGNPRLAAVVEGPPGALCLLVDGVLGLREISHDEITRDLGFTGENAQRSIRLTTRDLVSVLDLERFFVDERIVVGLGRLMPQPADPITHTWPQTKEQTP